MFEWLRIITFTFMHLADALSKATYKAIPAIIFLSVRYQLPIITNSSFVPWNTLPLKSYILN